MCCECAYKNLKNSAIIEIRLLIRECGMATNPLEISKRTHLKLLYGLLLLLYWCVYSCHWDFHLCLNIIVRLSFLVPFRIEFGTLWRLFVFWLERWLRSRKALTKLCTLQRPQRQDQMTNLKKSKKINQFDTKNKSLLSFLPKKLLACSGIHLSLLPKQANTMTAMPPDMPAPSRIHPMTLKKI